MNPLLASLGAYPLAGLQDLARDLEASGTAVLDFSIGDPVEPTPMFIRDALVAGIPASSRYPTAAGLPELRQAIAGWVRRRFGVGVDPDRHVLPTAGSKEAIFHLPLALVDPFGPRRAAVWGDPGYPVYDRGQQFAGGVSDPVALDPDDGWRLELGDLVPERLAAACLAWVNYPHNPTGAVVDAGYYRRQLEVAREAGVVLGSDECYQDIYDDEDAPPPSALQAAVPGGGDASDDELAGLVVAFSLSKRSGMTGYRSGALVGDPELIRQQRLLRPNIGTASPEFVQRAAVAAWSDDDHVAQRRAGFTAKRRVLAAFFDEVGLVTTPSRATFYLWVRVPGEAPDDGAYAKELLEAGVLVSPGSSFGPAGAGWLRLALVPDVAGCREAADRWRAAIATGALPGHA